MKRPSRTLYVLVMVVVSYCLTTASAEAKLDRRAVVADQLPQVEAPTQSKAGGNAGLRWQRAAVSRPETVRVRPGDSLSSIAEAVLGDVRGARIERFVARLFRHNRRVIGNDPDLIRPGQVLRLPRIGHVGASSRRAGTADVSAAQSRGLNLDRPRTVSLSDLRADHKVRVRRGDTLWSIVDEAMDALLSPSEFRKVARYKPLVGKSNLPALIAVAAQSAGGHSGRSVEQFVDRVYRTNRSVIGPDPDIIEPGQVIELPMFAGSPVMTFDQGLGSFSRGSIRRLSRSTAGLSQLVTEVGMIAGLSAKRVHTCCSGPKRVSTVADDAPETTLGLTARGAITPLTREHSKNGPDLTWMYPAATGILVVILLSTLRSPPAGRHSIRRQSKSGSRRRLGFVRPKGMGT